MFAGFVWVIVTTSLGCVYYAKSTTRIIFVSSAISYSYVTGTCSPSPWQLSSLLTTIRRRRCQMHRRGTALLNRWFLADVFTHRPKTTSCLMTVPAVTAAPVHRACERCVVDGIRSLTVHLSIWIYSVVCPWSVKWPDFKRSFVYTFLEIDDICLHMYIHQNKPHSLKS